MSRTSLREVLCGAITRSWYNSDTRRQMTHGADSKKLPYITYTAQALRFTEKQHGREIHVNLGVRFCNPQTTLTPARNYHVPPPSIHSVLRNG